uniref:Uncharacterized protein n=1 Tax=Rangifer tarandus platyrhynchus TaxID=3082113 RepID=A0ACB0EIT3_RANTA|nr:unnamed protein product [Rangifer tarandus platyrhynchus]
MSGALREGGHVDAARCAGRLGCLPAEGGADGADSAGTLRSNLQPPEPSQRAVFCYSTQVLQATFPAAERGSPLSAVALNHRDGKSCSNEIELLHLPAA